MPYRKYTADLLYAILECAHDGLAIVGDDGRLQLYNKACEALFGYSEEAIKGLQFSDLIPAVKDLMPSILKGGEISVLGRRQDGTNFDAMLSASSISTDEGAIICCIIRDVSYRKIAQQRLLQSRKMEAVGAIASTVAHDFNNFLSIISGSMRELKKRTSLQNPPDEKIALHIETIEQAVNRSVSQIARLMKFARASDKEEDEFVGEEANLNTFLEKMEAMINMSLRNNVRCDFDFSPDVSNVLIDKNELESALLNMVVNAVDAMPDGGTLTIKTQSVTLDQNYAMISPEITPGHYICLSVADTGMGMSAAVADRIFEPFYTTKPVGKGTGLGMSVVYSSIKKMGGYIHVYSEIRKGTIFKIYLPVIGQGSAAEKDDAALLNPAELKPSVDRKTVLIIDDNQLMRDMADQSFQRMGFATLVAADEAQAHDLLKAQSQPIDMMFVDMFLQKETNSFDVVDRLRAGLHSDCHVLYTSGYDRKHLASTYDLHGLAFIAKPFSRQDLVEKVKDL